MSGQIGKAVQAVKQLASHPAVTSTLRHSEAARDAIAQRYSRALAENEAHIVKSADEKAKLAKTAFYTALAECASTSRACTPPQPSLTHPPCGLTSRACKQPSLTRLAAGYR